ncbi:hypothetical protein VF21_04899 [Pseudogymnoascus sp. 05NY08]|nr:hypothetical protein VF21_04899 [Pseudogymnoascus sp. 05NY08]
MVSKSWLAIPRESHFSLANLPFGIISTLQNPSPRPAVAIGENVLDLSVFASSKGFSELGEHSSIIGDVLSETTLNSFAALGRPIHASVRKYLRALLEENTPYPDVLKSNIDLRTRAILPQKDVQNHLPMEIGDYTDFFAGVHHAFNIGVLFRGPENALQPNYMHLPVAYHGRASSVIVSGTAFKRPWGQVFLNAATTTKIPTFTPCKRLDIELELGMFVCKPSKLGEQIKVDAASEHIFGYVLMNDWSARDIQMWEYVPLGPFNAKNFATTISPWVVLADALEPFATAGLENKTELQSYLRESNKKSGLDIKLEVDITTAKGNTTTISRTNASNLMWSFQQMLSHHSVSGCPMRTGDLLGSGTISGSEPGTQGSLLEQIHGGKVALKLNGGEERKFLQDGDTVTIRGWAGGDEDAVVGFGSCTGTLLPALEL